MTRNAKHLRIVGVVRGHKARCRPKKEIIKAPPQFERWSLYFVGRVLSTIWKNAIDCRNCLNKYEGNYSRNEAKTQETANHKSDSHNITPFVLLTLLFILYQKGEKRCASRKKFCNFVCNKCHDGKKLWRCCDLSHKVERMSNNICKAIFMDGVFKYIHWLAS